MVKVFVSPTRLTVTSLRAFPMGQFYIFHIFGQLCEKYKIVKLKSTFEVFNKRKDYRFYNNGQ